MDIILIGAPGAGKGTQAESFLSFLESGILLAVTCSERHLKSKPSSRLKAQKYVDLGELVPDELTIPAVLRHVEEPESMQGVLLDGFPRTLAQAQALDAVLQGVNRQIDLAIYLKLSREELLKRIAGRLFCHAHQHVYHVQFRPPKVADTCDLDGSKLYQRPDDTGEALKRRLVVFFNEATQVLDHYSKQDKLRRVDGNQSIDQVTAMLLNEINDSMK